VIYREEALRTFKPRGNINEDLLLAITGMVGESGEIMDWLKKDRFHSKKHSERDLMLELGDLCWYMNLFYHLTRLEINHQARFESFRNVTEIKNKILLAAVQISYNVAIIGDMVQDYLAFDYPLVKTIKESNTTVLVRYLEKIHQNISLIANYYGHSMCRIYEMNIEKLNKRYPDPSII